MTDNRTRELVDALGLQEMNLESGMFCVEQVSAIKHDGQPVNNVIYFMLTREMPQSYLHHMASDDIQILIEGGPVDYYLFHDNGECQKITMGRDVANHQQMIVSVPGGTAKALVLHESAEHLLIGSVVSPAWSPTNTTYGADAAFIERFSGKADWARPEFLRRLVGPNFEQHEGGETTECRFTLTPNGEIIYQGMQLNHDQFLNECRRLDTLGVTIEIDGEATESERSALRDSIKDSL